MNSGVRLFGAIALLAVRAASAQTARPLPPLIEETVRGDLAAQGRHFRLGLATGAVHVWVPPGYRPATAATVLYVHGYYTDVDGAWRVYRLAEQFRASGKNALFVVPEAPSGGVEDVQFKDLPGLLATVTRLTRLTLPAGPLIAMGHSGAWRTLVFWSACPAVQELILLDALYADEPEFEAWLAQPAAPARRMILLAYETAVRSEAFLEAFPGRVRRNDVPRSARTVAPRERAAQLLYLQSQYDHMGIVTSGKVIPVLLQLAL